MLWVQGERYDLGFGDVVAVGFSVVALAPRGFIAHAVATRE